MPNEVIDTPEDANKPRTIDDILNQDFSLWKNTITSTTDDSVSFVIGGYYLQLRNPDNYFTTKDVFNLLYKNGLLLEDIQKCETHNLNVKNIIKVGTIKKKNKYRVNDDAIRLLHEILQDALL